MENIIEKVRGKFKNPWLVQRLNKGAGFVNPFGDVNRDIADAERQELMAQVISPDYMGAAEYEWGTYGKALAKLYESTPVKHRYELYDSSPVHTVAGAVMPKVTKNDSPVVIHIVCPLGMERDAEIAVQYVYDKPFHKFGERFDMSDKDITYRESFKADCGSFRSKVNTFAKGFDRGCAVDDNLVGWFSPENAFAWFMDRKYARAFLSLMTDAKDPVLADFSAK